ncbi:MAG: AI-2E family transporter [Desulfobulbaceae bacterium]|nr:AI-2E family transporter [Desulfobulbaceae bacterium]MCK5436614.1 AI-2E family transporter [Desulfobulbaceae bacterium]
MARLLWPFFSILVLSFLLTGIFKPVYSFFHKKFSPSFSSLTTCTLIVLLVFVPLMFFIGALSQEALTYFSASNVANLTLKVKETIHDSTVLERARDYLTGYGITLNSDELTQPLVDLAKMIGPFIYNQASSWAANAMGFMFNFFLMILIIFFLLTDHEQLLNYLLRLSPLPDEQERQLIRKFEEIAGAVMIGNGICGLIQGVIGGIIFAVLDLGSPVLWGGVMGILAFLPIFGIGLVLMPAAIILLLKGFVIKALGLLVLYVFISFSIEYILKPKIVGKQVKMHTLLVFLSILGGLSMFGFLGIIFGPLIVTAFLAFSEIYISDYNTYVTTGKWTDEKG